MENVLREQIAHMRQSFFDEGTLDSNYFVQLEQLEGPDNPTFVEEIITLFYRESMKMIATMENTLEKSPIDFIGINRMLNQIRVNSTSIGALGIKEKAIAMLSCVKENNLEGNKASLQEVKMEYDKFKGKLESYFQLMRQAGPIEKAVPPK
ncbi:pseudo histidine-containing phosphotransfer protein 2-like [Mercurialis annua]|uniref:pseudo histidine-containing phosphotransfer protein 2-like n=1 Tax=Mercurialis annua TaxID=3986 RepID=UPI002160B361|nr:pseudo histidine-containing phosphotransfer protein 2-like [Mercurialis annua]